LDFSFFSITVTGKYSFSKGFVPRKRIYGFPIYFKIRNFKNSEFKGNLITLYEGMIWRGNPVLQNFGASVSLKHWRF